MHIGAVLALGLPMVGRAAPPAVTPPRVESQVDPVYPATAREARREGTVTLLVTVLETGAVGAVEVANAAGADLDQAAIAAVKQWRFTPAQEGGRAIPARIRIRFRFALPTEAPPAPEPEVRALPTPFPAAAPAAPAAPPPDLIQVTTHGQKQPPPRAISDFAIAREILTLAPHRSAGDLLGTAPGVYVSRAEGDAVAHEIVLRGFDAQHGQDIALSVQRVPINQPSHIHGQGYADLELVIPEVVRAVRVTEGVYDPRQGDFAVAGSIDFDLGVPERGIRLRTEVGSFNTVRQLVLWAPEEEPDETFAAAQIRSSDGYGTNRGAISGGAIGQFAFDGPGGSHGLVQLAGALARANLAGVLRRTDVDADRVDFYGTYPDPLASQQSALSSRFQLAGSFDVPYTDGSRTSFAVWVARTDFELRENFTGYTLRSKKDPQWVGKGDLFDQQNHDTAFGLSASYRTPRFRPAEGFSGTFELGLSARADFIDQAEDLLTAPQNEIWDERVDATLQAGDIGLYGDLDWQLTRYVHLRGGMRADVLLYDVDDRLGNYLSPVEQKTHLPGYHRTAAGVAFGPRASVEVKPAPWLDLMVGYGQGYRSPQARLLDEGETAPFAKVHSLDGGFALRPLCDESLEIRASAFATFLSSDVAFDPGEGGLTKIGPTTRAGVVGTLLWRWQPWVTVSASLTYVHATLDEPPPATAENPAPAFTEGELLPYVPPVVFRADAAGNLPIAEFGGGKLAGQIGAGLTVVSPRPLPYGRFGAAVGLLDVRVSLRWRWIELGLEMLNLVGSRYAADEYSFVSDWGTTQEPSLLPARHLAAGPPRTITGLLTLHL
jgi:TonB family protein